jgi:hypothetical protein
VDDALTPLPLPAEIVELAAQAELGQISWESVAMHEKAHLGLVTYPTYARMAPVERARVGAINQSTARRKLGLP